MTKMKTTIRVSNILGISAIGSLLLFCTILTLDGTAEAAVRNKHNNKSTPKNKTICETGKGNNKFDRLLDQMWSYNEVGGPNYPENRKQLKSYCNESKIVLQAMIDYKEKCLFGDLKQYGAIVQYGVKSAMKRFCNNNRYNRLKISRMLELTPCVNNNKPVYMRCMNTGIRNLVGIKYADDTKKIPYMCCTMFRLINCWIDVTSQTSCRKKSQQVSEFLFSFLEGIPLEVVCGEYTEETDRCEKLGLPPTPRSNEPIPRTPISPFFDIINSMPEF